MKPVLNKANMQFAASSKHYRPELRSKNMAGDQSANPLGRNPFSVRERPDSVTGNYGRANPVGVDTDEPIELDTRVRITNVTKSWRDPPVVAPDFTPNLPGNSLKEALRQLEQYAEKVCEMHEWGRGGGDVSASYKLSPNGKTCVVELSGNFYVDLPKWTEYDTMTAPQKKAWDDMIALLEKHERQHLKIAYEGAQNLVRALNGLYLDQVDTTLTNSQNRTQTRQNEFDSEAQTDHGKKDWGAFKKVELDTSADPPTPPKKP
jgi:hypothetical protein